MTGINHAQIAACFNATFSSAWQVRIQGGAQEPLYRPAGSACTQSRLYYREDFAASALHEIAHWCIASVARLAREDFGYVYIPPPRTSAAQDQFLALELRTQALERVFAGAAGVPFRPSYDHFPADEMSRQRAVQQAVEFSAALTAHEATTHAWMRTPSGARAAQFLAALELACQQHLRLGDPVGSR